MQLLYLFQPESRESSLLGIHQIKKDRMGYFF